MYANVVSAAVLQNFDLACTTTCAGAMAGTGILAPFFSDTRDGTMNLALSCMSNSTQKGLASRRIRSILRACLDAAGAVVH